MLRFLICLPWILLMVLPILIAVCKARKAERVEREQQAAQAAAAELRSVEAARKQAAQEAKAAERERNRAAREVERQRKQDAKLEAARKLAEYKQAALQAERELQALRQQTILDDDNVPVITPEEFEARFAPRPFSVACMLAKKYADNANALDGKAFTITEKLDGVRCMARVDHGTVELYTRTGNRITGLADVERALAAMNISAVLDGELMIAGRGRLPSKDEYKQTCAIVRKHGAKAGIVYHVFDMLPMDEYNSRRAVTPYSARRAALDRLAGSQYVEIVPVLYSGTDTAMIDRHLQQQRAEQHEGIMLNVNDAPYSFGRTASLLKCKVMQDCDLRIVAVNPGTGRNAGSLGSLSVDYKGGIVRVGSGIPDALRRIIWANPAAYIGRVVTVQYFEETQDATGKKSLRFPVFKELREAGKTVSYA